MSKVKPCKLTNQYYAGQEGSVLNFWGHKFIIQPDGSAIAMIHRDFHETEVAYGRYIVLDDEDKKPSAFEMPKFTMEIDNYFGAGDLGKLRKKIMELRVDELISFTKDRFSLTLPSSMSKNEMVTEITNLVKTKTIQHPAEQTPDSTEDQLKELEKVTTTDLPKKKRGRPKSDKV